MKAFIIISLSLIVCFSTAKAQSDAKCRKVAKSGVVLLDTSVWIHDGRYNALEMAEGESIDIYKPFYFGRDYKIVVVSDSLNAMNIKALDMQRQEIYNQSTTTKSHLWSFTPNRNQNIILTVTVNQPVDPEKPKKGCVAVIIGYRK